MAHENKHWPTSAACSQPSDDKHASRQITAEQKGFATLKMELVLARLTEGVYMQTTIAHYAVMHA